MNFFRKHIAFRFFWFVLSIHLLNCSVDNPDTYLESVPEDLSFNDMESIAEIIGEQLFGIEDLFSETDDTDSDEEKTFAGFKVIRFLPIEIVDQPVLFLSSTLCYSHYNDKHRDLYRQEKDSPPPKI